MRNVALLTGTQSSHKIINHANSEFYIVELSPVTVDHSRNHIELLDENVPDTAKKSYVRRLEDGALPRPNGKEEVSFYLLNCLTNCSEIWQLANQWAKEEDLEPTNLLEGFTIPRLPRLSQRLAVTEPFCIIVTAKYRLGYLAKLDRVVSVKLDEKGDKEASIVLTRTLSNSVNWFLYRNKPNLN